MVCKCNFSIFLGVLGFNVSRLFWEVKKGMDVGVDFSFLSRDIGID